MAATLTQSEFIFRSGANSTSYYYFTVVVDISGNYSVRNVQSPNGLIQDSTSTLPKSVTDDITTAYTTVEDYLASTAAVSGTATFTAETSKAITFSTALNTASYSVFIDPGEFTTFKVGSKATTGFTITASTTFTGTVRYAVFI